MLYNVTVAATAPTTPAGGVVVVSVRTPLFVSHWKFVAHTQVAEAPAAGPATQENADVSPIYFVDANGPDMVCVSVRDGSMNGLYDPSVVQASVLKPPPCRKSPESV